MTKPFDRHHGDKDAAITQEGFEAAVDAAARDLVLWLGARVLFDGPLLNDWFIRYQLEREIQRAGRHSRPLSVVVMTPVHTGPALLDTDALAAAAAAAISSARATDLIGWLSGNRILLILPETDRDGAASAAYRLISEMSRQRLNQGRARWTVTAKADGHTYESAEELLDVVAAEVKREQTLDSRLAKRRPQNLGPLSA
jgi:hypothetical protein